MIPEVAAAYTATGGAWQAGPGRVYDRLAEVVVERCPIALADRAVLDVGAGTGAATRAAIAAGAGRVVAVDAATGMLAHDAANRPPAVAGDALALPFATAAFDAAIAAFSFNHLRDPGAGIAEAGRVVRPGGAVVAAAYAADDDHPVKRAVERALVARGWEMEPWYETMREEIVPQLSTRDGFAAAARAAGLRADVEAVRVPLPDLGGADLVAWRLGMAQHAPFVARLAPAEQDAVAADALDHLGPDVPPLERSIIVMAAVVA